MYTSLLITTATTTFIRPFSYPYCCKKQDQRPTYLKPMQGAQTEIRRQKTALEQKKLEQVRALGLCVVRIVESP